MAKKVFPLALVTGGARRLGRTFALCLARQGYAILLHYHTSKEKAEETAEEIRALGLPVYPVQADLTLPGQIEDLFKALDALPHQLQVLVNSAAVMPREPVQSLSISSWEAAFALNLRAPFLLSQQAAARLTAGGLIVNVTDVGAGKAWSAFPAYTVSKAGLESLTRVLARAYAPQIRVNAIAPGLIMRSEVIPLKEWDHLVDRLPLKHTVIEEEIADALVFLLRNESITGQTITVDSGYSLI